MLRSRNAVDPGEQRVPTPVTGSSSVLVERRRAWRGHESQQINVLAGIPGGFSIHTGNPPCDTRRSGTPSCASSALSDAALPSPTCCWMNRQEASAVSEEHARPARAAKRAKRLEKTFPPTALEKISAGRRTGATQEKSRDIVILRLRFFVSEWGRERSSRLNFSIRLYIF